MVMMMMILMISEMEVDQCSMIMIIMEQIRSRPDQTSEDGDGGDDGNI